MTSRGWKSASNPTSHKNGDVAEMRAESLGNEKIFQEALAKEIEDRVNDIDDSIFRPSRSSKKARVDYLALNNFSTGIAEKQNKESQLVIYYKCY